MSADRYNGALANGGDVGSGWSVVVPVKHGERGKSRLEADGVDRVALARAIALDTIDAVSRAARVAEVVVVTDDPVLRDALTRDLPGGHPSAGRPTAPPTHNEGRTGADTPDRFHPGEVPDGSPSLCITRAGVVVAEDPGRGLNGALAAGLATARQRPAALLGDVPALRPGDLDAALALAERATGPAVVADADGTGTTLLANASPGILRFGAGSYAAHLAAGASPLDIPTTSTLRHDVDTADQLAAARALGLGPRTAALLTEKSS